MSVEPFVLPTMIPSLEEIAVPITGPITEGEPDIIPGLLPRGGQLVIAGETEVGKTLIALEMCSALTTGQPIWGHDSLRPSFTANKILYVLGEHYNEVIQRLWRKTQLPMSENVWLIGPDKLGPDKWLVTNGKTNMTAVDKFKRWAEGADLIIFDPLAAFVSGVDVENDNAQMRAVLDTMSLITQGCGAACLILAHQGKPTIDQRSGKEIARKKYAIRGASAIEDAATNIFYMGRADRAEEETKEHKVFVLTKRKYKGEAPDEYRLMRDPETLCHTALDTSRPFTEVKKIETQAKIGRLRMAYPDMKLGDLYKIVSIITGQGERTLERYMQGN
jgi:RecA-family ATPase